MRGLLKLPLQAFFQTRLLVLAIGGDFLLARLDRIGRADFVSARQQPFHLFLFGLKPRFFYFARHAQLLAGIQIVFVCRGKLAGKRIQLGILVFFASDGNGVNLCHGLGVRLAVVEIGGRLGLGDWRSKQGNEQGGEYRHFDLGEHLGLLGDDRTARIKAA